MWSLTLGVLPGNDLCPEPWPKFGGFMQPSRPLLALAVLCTSVFSFAAAPQNKPSPSQKPSPHKQASASPVRFSNPATMAKPVSIYSQVVEVTGGKTVYIAGQVALDISG